MTIITKYRCNSSYWNCSTLIKYHDNIWCKPEHNDNEIFAILCLEIFAAGLSWKIVLEKEIHLRNAFDNFNPSIVALYNDNNIKNIMCNTNIIRNIRKIKSTINNAKVFLNIQKEFKSFDKYIWHFTEGTVIDNNIDDCKYIPAKNELSERICKDMKQRGFQFIGPITIYSFMQGIGIVNDHWKYCEYR